MRIVALALFAALAIGASTTTAESLEIPEKLSDNMQLIIEEHQVIIAAPESFKTQRHYDNMYEWARFICDLYHRDAVGPVSWYWQGILEKGFVAHHYIYVCALR